MDSTENRQPGHEQDAGVSVNHLDGNALAGALDQFVADLTSAECTCAECGAKGPLAAALLYSQAPGMVLRCPTCTAVLLCLTDQGPRQVLTVDGVRSIIISRA